MAKTDWNLNDIVRPQDMNDIGEEINQLRNDIDNIDVPPASLTKAGVVQLNDNVNDTSTTTAATANAVKKAYDRAEQAFQLGNERKSEVVAALVAKGISASTSESWDSLIAKMEAIIKATGNATSADVLSGKTFSNASGNNLTGSMPNRGAGGTVTPGATNQTKAAGYYSSAITVLGEPNLVAGNLPKDKTFFGISGLLERMTTAEKQAIANSITGKGVPASVSDTNTLLAQKIGQIAEKKYIVVNVGTLGGGSSSIIVDFGFIPDVVFVYGDINGSPAAVALLKYDNVYLTRVFLGLGTGHLDILSSDGTNIYDTQPIPSSIRVKNATSSIIIRNIYAVAWG